MDNKIPFGLQNGRLLEVSEVSRGLACDCICPGCKRRLQANKGSLTSAYFSHDPSGTAQGCSGGFETAIHLMAKQILSENSGIQLPELSIIEKGQDVYGITHTESDLVTPEGYRAYNEVILEKSLDDIRPDIIIYKDSIAYLVEIAVTSFCDDLKLNSIRKKDLRAIEIDLSKVNASLTKAELRELLIKNTANKTWLHHPKTVFAREKLKSRLRKKIALINAAQKTTSKKNNFN